MTLLLASHSTPLGTIKLLAHEHILVGANFSTEKALFEGLSEIDSERDVEKVSRIPVISDLLEDYFDGDINALNSVQTRQPGAKFSQLAWREIKKVKAGRTISYAELALRAGSAGAVRAAGTACGKNAVVLFIPCHRIVKSGGALGNYGYGVNKKEWLLRHENALQN